VLWTAPGCALIPVESVVGHIEVKSTLNAADIAAAVQAAGELVQISVGSAPVGLVFAFNSDLAGDRRTELDRLLSARETHWRHRPGFAWSPIQALCVVGKGCWLHTIREGQEGWNKVEPQDEREVLTFASVLSNTLFGQVGVGAGAYLLDDEWLGSPILKCPRVLPK
jgi:hypothetical protein